MDAAEVVAIEHHSLQARILVPSIVAEREDPAVWAVAATNLGNSEVERGDVTTMCQCVMYRDHRAKVWSLDILTEDLQLIGAGAVGGVWDRHFDLGWTCVIRVPRACADQIKGRRTPELRGLRWVAWWVRQTSSDERDGS